MLNSIGENHKKTIILSALIGVSTFSIAQVYDPMDPCGRMTWCMSDVAVITVSDTDKDKLPESFLLEDDDGSNPVLILSSERKLKQGEEIPLNDHKYKVKNIGQTVELVEEE